MLEVSYRAALELQEEEVCSEIAVSDNDDKLLLFGACQSDVRPVVEARTLVPVA